MLARLPEAQLRPALRRQLQVDARRRQVDELARVVPSAQGKLARDGKTTAYLCREGLCELPTSDPKQFADYVRGIRTADRLRGKPGKRVLAVEEDVRKVSRQSLVLCRDLRPGDLLRSEDLIIQRPGTGIPAAMSERVVGRKILRSLEAGTLLQWDMLSDAA